MIIPYFFTQSFTSPILYKDCITAISIIFCSIFYTSYYILRPQAHREDWRSLTAQIPLDSQIFTYPSVNAPLRYYYSGQILNLNDIENSKIENLFIVPYAQEILDPQLEYQAFLKDNGYQLIQKQYFNSVPLEVWQKN